MKYPEKCVCMAREIWLLFIVLAVSGCVSAPSGEPQDVNLSEFNQTDSENVTMVYYTDTGFVPDDITVSEGQEVRWIDESSGQMWVAADEHPVHAGYDNTTRREHCPGESFDQCSSGQVYSFTFERSGEFDYHNHRDSRHSGTVKVE